MNKQEVMSLLPQAVKIKGLNKDLKKELKETCERCGEHFDFLQKYDIERIIQIPENDLFVSNDMAAFVISSKLEGSLSTQEFEDLFSIAGRSVDSLNGPGLNNKELALKVLDKALESSDIDGYFLANLIVIAGEDTQMNDKEVAKRIAEKAINDVDDADALEYLVEVVEDECFLGDAELAKKLSEKGVLGIFPSKKT